MVLSRRPSTKLILAFEANKYNALFQNYNFLFHVCSLCILAKIKSVSAKTCSVMSFSVIFFFATTPDQAHSICDELFINQKAWETKNKAQKPIVGTTRYPGTI